jgi:5'(3')-deoxyribonucleotidase
MKQLKDKVLKLELVNWKELIPLSNPDLKDYVEDGYNKLRNSLTNHDFKKPLHIWEHKKNEVIKSLTNEFNLGLTESLSVDRHKEIIKVLGKYL